MADDAEVAQLRQLLEFAQRDAGYADELRAQLIAERARIAAVEALADEVHGHGADDERAEVERLRGIISRIAALAASPTPSRNDPHAWDGNETCRCGRGRYSALHEMFDLAASATPTGPEPAKRPCCARPGWCACDPLTPGDEHCQWFVAATPERTEETPRCQEPTCPDFGDPDFGEATCPSDHAEENR